MSPPATATFTAATPTGPVPNANAEDEDYVWDVFYQRPTKLSEWNAVANIGTLYVHLYHISHQVSDVTGSDYPLPRPIQVILTQTPSRKTRLTRTPMVSEPASITSLTYQIPLQTKNTTKMTTQKKKNLLMLVVRYFNGTFIMVR